MSEMINNPSEVLCYIQYKLGKVDGKFSADMRKVRIPATPMMRGTAEAYNENTQDSGLLFVVDNEATEKFREYQKQRKIDNEANKLKKSLDAKELFTSAFDVMMKGRTGSDNQDGEPTVKEMKDICIENGYPKKEWQLLKKSELTEYLKSKTE
jgi:hypothetical protein